MRKLITLLLLSAVVYSGCKKNEFAANNAATPKKADSIPPDKIVFTPFGPRKASDVHHVEDGYRLEFQGNQLLKIQNSTGKISANFGVQKSVISQEAINKAKQIKTNSTNPPTPNDGWVTFADWTNPTSTPISYFSTTWKVPGNPASTVNGYQLYIFNGIQNADHILQPVLQYGASPAGGGLYWAIDNWYAGCATCPAYFATPVPVSPGTSLQGIMQLTGQTGSNYNYKSSFAGYPASSSLQINNIPQLYYAVETFEQYTITSGNQYPSDVQVNMTNIELKLGTAEAQLNWQPHNIVTNNGQNTVIVSNNSPGGEVDLYFRTPPPPVPTININGKVSYDWNSPGGNGSGTIKAPAGTLVHVGIDAYGVGVTTKFTLSGATLIGYPSNTITITNGHEGTPTPSFTMPASGSVNWSGTCTMVNSSGFGSIYVF